MKRVKVPQVVKNYGCKCWVQWFRKMYPVLSQTMDNGKSYSAPTKLKEIGDPMYMDTERKQELHNG